MTLGVLLRAGLKRSRWRSAVGAGVALIAAGALFLSAVVFTGMQRTLRTDVQRLGASLILAPRGQDGLVRALLTTGKAPEPLAESISLSDFRGRIATRKVLGLEGLDGWSLAEGGAGSRAVGDKVSLVLVRLEPWASPLLAALEIEAAVPEAEVVVAEQVTRQVARDLTPVVRYTGIGAGVAVLGAVLLLGLLTGLRVAERRAELGMLRAMGATRAFLLRLTLAETGLPAAAGGVAGVAAGLIALWAGRLPGRALSVGEVGLFALGALTLTWLAAMLAALAPALRAARMDPLEAVRRGQ